MAFNAGGMMIPMRRCFVCMTSLLALACQGPASNIEVANKDTAFQLYAAIDAQDYDKLRQFISEDFVLRVVGMPEPLGRDETFGLMKEFYAAFPDYTHVIEEMVAEGDRVAIRLRFDATHQGEFMGIPAADKKVSYVGVQVLTIVDGVCTESWALDDNLGFMSQLGMKLMPADEGT